MLTIHKKSMFYCLVVMIVLTSCNLSKEKGEPVWSELPEVISIDSLKQTDFVTTLENPLSKTKNTVYAPAFLFAWDKIKQVLQSPIKLDSTHSLDFILLNKSSSFQNSLDSTEYTASAKFVDGVIKATAFFNKTLPFEAKLQVFEEPIRFDSTKISAFGMYSYDQTVVRAIDILYYKNDSDFVVKLTPKDKTNEIILIKTLQKYQTLKEAVNLTDSLIALGELEITDSKNYWKYKMNDQDILAIPMVKFNVGAHFKTIEGQVFSTNSNVNVSIIEAYQRTGFIFNENGAVVESQAVVEGVTSTAEPIINLPKRMFFDKPFVVIIKKTGKANPYFVMKVANAELLIRK